MKTTSNILGQAKAYCQATGLDFEALYRQAYPDEELPEVQEGLSVSKRALPRILDALEDINYHRFYTALAEAAGYTPS